MVALKKKRQKAGGQFSVPLVIQHRVTSVKAPLRLCKSKRLSFAQSQALNDRCAHKCWFDSEVKGTLVVFFFANTRRVYVFFFILCPLEEGEER